MVDEQEEPIQGADAGQNASAADEAQRAFQESESRYRALTELSPDAILVNSGGLYVYANMAAARLVGTDDVHNLIGHSPFEFMEPEFREVVRERIRYVLEEQANSTPLEYRWRRIDGSPVDVEVTAGPISWDGKAAIQVMVRDVGERKRTEKAAYESEEKYRTLFNSLDTGFCIIEVLFDAQEKPTDYRFLEVNPAFEQQTGLQNAVGRRVREFIPNHETRWFELYGHIATTGEAMRFEDPAAEIDRFYEVYAFRVGQPSERKVAVLFTDIAARKRLEQQTAELLKREQEARREAERAVTLQRLFLGMISHELRTPLASIKGFSSSLLAPDIEFGPEQSREFIQIIDQEADTLTDLIDQLLDAVRVQTGNLTVAPEANTLEAIVERVMPQIEMLTEHHQLRLNLPVDLPEILADKRRIGQVLVNLIGNATKFSPPQTPILVSAQVAGDNIQISVSDEGRGIPASERTQVFEIFHRVAREHIAQPGAGLGLAICKGIVEAHGGTIWIEERPTPGTTVSFTLPIAINLSL